eukprot:gene3583-6318_t
MKNNQTTLNAEENKNKKQKEESQVLYIVNVHCCDSNRIDNYRYFLSEASAKKVWIETIHEWEEYIKEYAMCENSDYSGDEKEKDENEFDIKVYYDKHYIETGAEDYLEFYEDKVKL